MSPPSYHSGTDRKFRDGDIIWTNVTYARTRDGGYVARVFPT